MFVWRIEGEASNESGGGSMTIMALTPDEASSPDPHEALELAAPRYGWYRITSITQVAELPNAWDVNNCEFGRLAGLVSALAPKSRPKRTRPQ